jgi:LmbE family N-acetylglucosaminyl deacetylase
MSKSILLIFAHPDDESFITAGTACRYGDAGVRVALVCATLGGAGKLGEPPIATREELPAVRDRELRDACAILGIDIVGLLGYRDRELAAAPPDAVRDQLVRAIRRERPDIVITFDPNGANVHPDHVAISRFASDAIAAASDPRWFPEAGPAHQVRRVLWTLNAATTWGSARPEDIATQPGVDFIIDIAPWRDRKARALRAHRSQHVGIERIWFTPAHSGDLLSTEIFRLAWGEASKERPARDLFEGMEQGRERGSRKQAAESREQEPHTQRPSSPG